MDPKNNINLFDEEELFISASDGTFDSEALEEYEEYVKNLIGELEDSNDLKM